MCDRAILLEEGSMIADGTSAAVSDLYEQRIGTHLAASGHSTTHFSIETIVSMEGQLFRGNGTVLEEQKIFIIRDGRKHWITHGDWLTKNGFAWPQDVNFVEGGVVQQIPDGDPINLEDV
jgi:hypothetical protein